VTREIIHTIYKRLYGNFEYGNILTTELIKSFVNGVDNFSSHSKTSVAGIELDIKKHENLDITGHLHALHWNELPFQEDVT
jgi:hypothetical protein